MSRSNQALNNTNQFGSTITNSQGTTVSAGLLGQTGSSTRGTGAGLSGGQHGQGHGSRSVEMATDNALGAALTCVPEVQFVQLRQEDSFLLLATDGLFDVMSSQDAVNFVIKALAECTFTIWVLARFYHYR